MLVFATLIGTSFAGQVPPPTKVENKKVQAVPKLEEDLPVKSDYEHALKRYTEWSKKFNDPEYWKNVTLTRVSDKKELKVKDLPEFDRQSFYLSNLQRLTFELTRLNGFWQDELKKYALKPPTHENAPTLDELKGYVEKLTDLRKETAKILENYAEKFTKDNAEKLTKDEIAELLKKIRDYNDENKLIERKKK
jgi:hypothetical protein